MSSIVFFMYEVEVYNGALHSYGYDQNKKIKYMLSKLVLNGRIGKWTIAL